MNELEMMKKEPRKLYDYYIDLLLQGIALDDGQVVKMEYLKRLLLKEE